MKKKSFFNKINLKYNKHFFVFSSGLRLKHSADSLWSHTHTDRTHHGRVGGLVPGADKRPASIWTPEYGVLGEQLAGWAGAERLHRRAGAAGQLTRVLLRRPVQSHEDAAQRRVGASCRRDGTVHTGNSLNWPQHSDNKNSGGDHCVLYWGSLILTWPVGDQTVSALRLHLDVGAAGRLQRQDMRSVRGLADLLPETPALQRAGDQPTTGKRAGCSPWDVAQRRHWTPGNKTRGPSKTRLQTQTSTSFWPYIVTTLSHCA